MIALICGGIFFLYIVWLFYIMMSAFDKDTKS